MSLRNFAISVLITFLTLAAWAQDRYYHNTDGYSLVVPPGWTEQIDADGDLQWSRNDGNELLGVLVVDSGGGDLDEFSKNYQAQLGGTRVVNKRLELGGRPAARSVHKSYDGDAGVYFATINTVLVAHDRAFITLTVCAWTVYEANTAYFTGIGDSFLLEEGD